MKKAGMLTLLVLMAAMAMSTQPSPYINKVYEYRPAPGQFINVLPQYEEGDTEADMLRKVHAQIADTIGKSNYICLGGWGGYVVFGFDHTIVNIEGQADFEVGGNYFAGRQFPNPYSTKNPTGTFSHDTIRGGSSEPGIIFVSHDDNGNGLPDDEWYEIAGSEYPYTITDYQVTYTRPTPPSADVVGVDAAGDTLLVKHNAFHAQAYFPLWLSDTVYTLSGSKMPNNIVAGTMNLLTMDYGYADNAENGTEANGIDIGWAVQADGSPANLTGIDFVKVQTGVRQDGMAMGETSTEVTGARDLHPEMTELLLPVQQEGTTQAVKCLKNGQLHILRNGTIFTTLGQTIR